MKIGAQNHAIRDELRTRTRDVHEKLHEHSLFVDLFNGTIAPQQYFSLMKAFHGFYAPMEQAIDRALSQDPRGNSSFVYVKRTNLLTQDLLDLGHKPGDVDQNRTCGRIAEAVTPQSLAGVLYVIEGSTLGAAQIDRAAQRLLQSDKTHGRQFWAWSRENNKSRWEMINRYLLELEKAAHPVDAIIQGANDTFQALADWLAPLDQPHKVSEGAVL